MRVGDVHDAELAAEAVHRDGGSGDVAVNMARTPLQSTCSGGCVWRRCASAAAHVKSLHGCSVTRDGAIGAVVTTVITKIIFLVYMQAYLGLLLT